MDFIALSIPVFFFLIGLELVCGLLRKTKNYRFHDAITNINLGIGQQITGVLMKSALFLGYLYLYQEHRFFSLGNSLAIWAALFIGVDFFYYWFHRMSHQVNALWAAHIVHHQSEDYNFSVALRQSWFQGWFSWVFYLPLALIGFDPIMFAAMSSFNTLYQFWIHTTAIKSLGPLEWVLNTPSHHRVHHGSDPKYLDKNHAGSLIIWDRLFGTFCKEEEEPTYGITKALNSWNPIWANLHYWKELWELAKRSKGIDKVLVFLKHPGWRPAYLGGFEVPKEIDRNTYKKYDSHTFQYEHLYTLFLFLTALSVGTAVLFLQSAIPPIALYSTMGYLVMALGISGGLMECRRWAIPAEYIRILATPVLALLYWPLPAFNIILIVAASVVVVNVPWFWLVAKRMSGNRIAEV